MDRLRTTTAGLLGLLRRWLVGVGSWFVVRYWVSLIILTGTSIGTTLHMCTYINNEYDRSTGIELDQRIKTFDF